MENLKNLKEEYLRQSVMTASPAELVVMLFDGCINDLKFAEMALEEPANYMKANEYFIKAQNIISELVATLDMSYEISNQLLPVYEYLLWAMRKMNVKKDLTAMPDVLKILQTQRDTWAEAARMSGSGQEGRQACV